jgi:hypothetical protein
LVTGSARPRVPPLLVNCCFIRTLFTNVGSVNNCSNRRTRRPWPRPELVLWRAAFPPDSASGVVDGAPLTSASPLQTSTAGVRSCRRSQFCGAGGARPTRPGLVVLRPPIRYPADLRGKCFNYLSTMHRVVTCKLPPCCFCCKGFWHLARDCKQWGKVPSSNFSTIGAPDGRLQHPVREPISSNRPCAHGCMSGAAGVEPGATAAMPGAATRGSSGCRRRRRH